jgi:hypothetical protein
VVGLGGDCTSVTSAGLEYVGFSLHANTAVDAADRAALERLARYLLRPLISADRLTVRPDGRVEYRFRRPAPTGK